MMAENDLSKAIHLQREIDLPHMHGMKDEGEETLEEMALRLIGAAMPER
jgi:hypothetical protein